MSEPVGSPISREEARRIALETLERAERERSEYANRCATEGCDGMDAFQLIGVIKERDAEIERLKRILARFELAARQTVTWYHRGTTGTPPYFVTRLEEAIKYDGKEA